MVLSWLLLLAATAASLVAAQDLALYGSGADTGYASTWQVKYFPEDDAMLSIDDHQMFANSGFL